MVGKQVAEIWGAKGGEEVREWRDNTLKKFGWEGRRYSIQRRIFEKEETGTYLCTKRKNEDTEQNENDVRRNPQGKEEGV